MNIIIGKNGFIARKLSKKGKYSFTSTNSNESIYLNLKEPHIFNYSIFDKNTNIILLAAVSSPDECNNHYENSYSINVTGTKYFITEALKQGAKVLFFSSDVVYGNCEEIVDERSQTNPFGNYAKMKDYIEKAFKGEKNFKVFRLSYVLSQEDKYLSYLQSCVNQDKIAEVFHPFNRKVVYIEDVLDAIENVLVKWDDFSNQKFNICGKEDISRKDIADFYNEATGNKLKYSIVEPDNKFWEARPKDINITSLHLEKLLGRQPTKIKDAMITIIQGEK